MKNNLRQIRRDKGLTLKQLAQKSGRYAWQTIGAYENSEKPLGREFLLNMSEILECSIESIQADPQMLKEAGSQYGLALSELPLHTLKQMAKNLSEEMTTASGPEYQQIVSTLAKVTKELNDRLFVGSKSAELAVEATEIERRRKP